MTGGSLSLSEKQEDRAPRFRSPFFGLPSPVTASKNQKNASSPLNEPLFGQTKYAPRRTLFAKG